MGISIWQLLIILAIVLVLFGAKRLKNVGSDIGGAIKGFKKSVQDEQKKTDDEDKVLDTEKEKDNVFNVKSEDKTEPADKSNKVK
jgi:sec-independent protein translocase protein TatA